MTAVNLQQLVQLLGGIVGAFGAYSVSAASDRRRWLRTVGERWDSARMLAYSEYANAVKSVTMWAPVADI